MTEHSYTVRKNGSRLIAQRFFMHAGRRSLLACIRHIQFARKADRVISMHSPDIPLFQRNLGRSAADLAARVLEPLK